MRQQGIPAIDDMRYRVSLVFTQINFGGHPIEGDMTAVIFTRTYGVKEFIVRMHQILTAVRIFPDPVTESFLNGLLFLLGERSLFLIQYTFFFSFSVLNRIVDTDITEIQRIFQNPISVCPVCAVCHVSGYVV